MIVAGVSLPTSGLLWVDCAQFTPRLLDRVTVLLSTGEAEGEIYVAPDQVLRAPPQIAGKIVSVATRTDEITGCYDLPGSGMPPLGSERGGGLVIAIDPVTGTVTVRLPDGHERTETL